MLSTWTPPGVQVDNIQEHVQFFERMLPSKHAPVARLKDRWENALFPLLTEVYLHGRRHGPPCLALEGPLGKALPPTVVGRLAGQAGCWPAGSRDRAVARVGISPSGGRSWSRAVKGILATGRFSLKKGFICMSNLLQRQLFPATGCVFLATPHSPSFSNILPLFVEKVENYRTVVATSVVGTTSPGFAATVKSVKKSMVGKLVCNHSAAAMGEPNLSQEDRVENAPPKPLRGGGVTTVVLFTAENPVLGVPARTAAGESSGV